MKNSHFLMILPFLLAACSTSKTSKLEQILSDGSAQFQSVLKNPKHEVQIIYGEVAGDSIIQHTFNVDPGTYFYPASTIKMPVAIAAFKKAQEEGIGLDDYLVIDSTGIYPRAISYDSVFQDSITIRNLAKLIFTVSDNAANNLLFGWLGRDYLNDLYGSMGIQTRIVHQLGESAFSFKPISNHYTRQGRILKESGEVKPFEEVQQSLEFDFIPTGQQKGLGYIDSLGNLVEEPFDFSQKNFVPLQSLLTILASGVRPDLLGEQSLGLTSEYQQALLETMDLLPKDLPVPYDTLSDNYVKFFMYGNDNEAEIPSSIRIRNKVGWAYGYLLDIAYIEDLDNDISFFLAAVIHVNENQIYNDGVYEYEEIGLPFLDELGDLVYAYELGKKTE